MSGVDLWNGWATLVGRTSWLEATAALLGVVEVVLAIGTLRLNWIAAFLSTLLYARVLLDSHLYLQSGLQVFYLIVAVHGWRVWGRDDAAGARSVTRGGLGGQLGVVAGVMLLGLLVGGLLKGSSAADPGLDAVTTAASLYATWLQAEKRLENWAWWVVIDAATAVLFARQGLWASVVLYGLFSSLAAVGWYRWSRLVGARA